MYKQDDVLTVTSVHYIIYAIYLNTDIPPSALNVNITCSSAINVTTRSYDIIVVFNIDATFSPSEVAAIESIRTTSVEVDGSGNVVPSTITREEFPFEGVESGPGNITLIISDQQPLSDRQGFYSVQVL